MTLVWLSMLGTPNILTSVCECWTNCSAVELWPPAPPWSQIQNEVPPQADGFEMQNQMNDIL